MAAERLPLDAVLGSTALTGATAANLDDDPDSPDGNWATLSGSAGDSTEVYASFGTPSATLTDGAGLQGFRVLVRQSASGGTAPDARIELWENGSLVRAGSDTTLTAGTSGEVIELTWNATEISAAADVEVKLIGTGSGGMPADRRSVEVGAIEWNADVSADTNVSANVDALTLTANAATVDADTEVDAGVDALTLTGNQADVDAATEIDAGTASLTVSTFGATVDADTEVDASTASLTVTANQATVDADTEVDASVSALTLSTFAATVSTDADVDVSATTDALTLTGQQADVSLNVNVAAGVDALTLSTYGATIDFDVEVSASTATLTVTGTQSIIDLDQDVSGSEIIFNQWFRGTTTRGSDGDFPPCAGIIMGDDDEAYGVMQWGGNNQNCCKIVRLWDGVVVADIEGTVELANDVSAVHGLSHSYSQRASGGAVGNGTHAFAIAQDTSVGGSLGAAWACVFYKVDSGGNVVADGVYVGLGSSVTVADMLAESSAIAAGIKGSNFVAVFDEGSGSLQTVCLPPPGTDTDEFSGSPSPRPFSSRVLQEDDATVIEGTVSSWSSRFGHNGALFWANGELYGYFNKAICTEHNDLGGAPAPVDLEAATYSDGFICRFTTSISTVNGYNSLEITGYTVINTSVPNFPWADQSLASDDSTTDYQDDYWLSPGVSYLESGTPVIIFAKTFDDSTDRNPTGTRGRYRAYSITGTSWRELLDTGDDNLYDVEDDLGAPPGGRYNMSYVGESAVWDRVRNNLYLIQQADSSSPSPATSAYVISKVGDFIVTPGGHVVVNVNII